jgi:hypothetical protein
MARKEYARTVGSRQLHDPGRDEATPKASRVPGPPGRLGEMNDEPMSDLSARGRAESSAAGQGCVYVRGDGEEVRREVEYQIRAQTGTTAGAGKRTRGGKMGTSLGLPIDEPRHGEIVDADSEPIEGGNVAIEPRRKLHATE